MIAEHLFTLESEMGQSSSVYKILEDRLTIWIKVGAGTLEVGTLEDVAALIDLLSETINQVEQEL
jgi:hypothetical protein